MRDADVVVTATGASEPLFAGDWLGRATHVNAIGSNQAQSRELDLDTLTVSGRDRRLQDVAREKVGTCWPTTSPCDTRRRAR